jgi:hypothetical protein
LGRRLYDVRKELCEQLNLKSIILGRIPNYGKFKDEITPKIYIEKVKKKEIYDPVLSFQLSNDSMNFVCLKLPRRRYRIFRICRFIRME